MRIMSSNSPRSRSDIRRLYWAYLLPLSIIIYPALGQPDEVTYTTEIIYHTVKQTVTIEQCSQLPSLLFCDSIPWSPFFTGVSTLSPSEGGGSVGPGGSTTGGGTASGGPVTGETTSGGTASGGTASGGTASGGTTGGGTTGGGTTSGGTTSGSGGISPSGLSTASGGLTSGGLSTAETNTASSTNTRTSADEQPTNLNGFTLETVGGLGIFVFKFDDADRSTFMGPPEGNGLQRAVQLSLSTDGSLTNSDNRNEFVFLRPDVVSPAFKGRVRRQLGDREDKVDLCDVTYGTRDEMTEADIWRSWYFNGTELAFLSQTGDIFELYYQQITLTFLKLRMKRYGADIDPAKYGIQRASLVYRAPPTTRNPSTDTRTSSRTNSITTSRTSSRTNSGGPTESPGTSSPPPPESSAIISAYDIITSDQLSAYCSAVLGYSGHDFVELPSTTVTGTTTTEISTKDDTSTGTASTTTTTTSSTLYEPIPIPRRRRGNRPGRIMYGYDLFDKTMVRRQPPAPTQLASFNALEISLGCRSAYPTAINSTTFTSYSVYTTVSTLFTTTGTTRIVTTITATGTITETIPIFTERYAGIGWMQVLNGAYDQNFVWASNPSSNDRTLQIFKDGSTSDTSWTMVFQPTLNSYTISRGGSTAATTFYWTVYKTPTAFAQYKVLLFTAADIVQATQQQLYFKFDSATHEATLDKPHNPDGTTRTAFWVCTLQDSVTLRDYQQLFLYTEGLNLNSISGSGSDICTALGVDAFTQVKTFQLPPIADVLTGEFMLSFCTSLLQWSTSSTTYTTISTERIPTATVTISTYTRTQREVVTSFTKTNTITWWEPTSILANNQPPKGRRSGTVTFISNHFVRGDAPVAADPFPGPLSSYRSQQVTNGCRAAAVSPATETSTTTTTLSTSIISTTITTIPGFTLTTSTFRDITQTTATNSYAGIGKAELWRDTFPTRYYIGGCDGVTGGPICLFTTAPTTNQLIGYAEYSDWTATDGIFRVNLGFLRPGQPWYPKVYQDSGQGFEYYLAFLRYDPYNTPFSLDTYTVYISKDYIYRFTFRYDPTTWWLIADRDATPDLLGDPTFWACTINGQLRFVYYDGFYGEFTDQPGVTAAGCRKIGETYPLGIFLRKI
ncbi:hypothetical protein TWF281_007120 [Arthrobotrys megalospora]